jgi:hypothetical protein
LSLPKLVTVGDFAGFSATFAPTTGQLVPIPDYWVPKELLEWGQAPSSLEIIVSEDVHDNDTSSTDNMESWSRQTVTVFPAVGCGVDNLHTQKQELLWKTIWQEDTVRVAVKAAAATAAAAAVDPAKQVWTVEASFGWDPDQLKEDSVFYLGRQQQSSRSIRVAATIQDAAAVLTRPCTLERQTNADSGGDCTGNGLDGRQVVQLLGKLVQSIRLCYRNPFVRLLEQRITPRLRYNFLIGCTFPVI